MSSFTAMKLLVRYEIYFLLSSIQKIYPAIMIFVRQPFISVFKTILFFWAPLNEKQATTDPEHIHRTQIATITLKRVICFLSSVKREMHLNVWVKIFLVKSNG